MLQVPRDVPREHGNVFSLLTTPRGPQNASPQALGLIQATQSGGINPTDALSNSQGRIRATAPQDTTPG